jgi:protein-disulfide isomerase
MQLGRIARFTCFVIGFAAFAVRPGFTQTAAPEPPSAPTSQIPAMAAPAPARDADPFPAPDQRNFTADTPTVETVNAFLKANFGFDPNRIWKVEDILKTPVPGLSKVIVYLAEKGQDKIQPVAFFALPDGKHLIAGDDVLPFGVRPFEANRELLQNEAKGPTRGASSKDLEIVEFADFECPHCKEAQDTMQKLLQDYPMAHFVYENYPIVEIHSEAFKAAAYGHCVAKLAGDAAFYKFSDEIFANQAQLTPQTSSQALQDAVLKAGGDPAKIAACAASDEAKAAVNASIDLGNRLGVEGTPSLYVNGRSLQAGGNSFLGIPYNVLRDIIDFQAQQDGVNVPVRPASTPGLTLQPPQPSPN